MSRKILVRWKCDVCGKKLVVSRDKIMTVHAMFVDKRPDGWHDLYPEAHQAGNECDECAEWMSSWKNKQGRDNDPIKARRKHLGLTDKEVEEG